MNVLSLFDGMSCGRIALGRAGVKVDAYYSSEIDKYAIKVADANYPENIKLGDVRGINGIDLPKIDLLIGGSPCQGFSFAGKQLNFDDPRSALFFEYVRLLKELKPKYFMMENVRMKKEYQAIISDALGVEPVAINSNLVSAQNRYRLYWTNIPGVGQPEDKGIMLRDIIEGDVVDRDKAHCLDANYFKGGNMKSYFDKHRRQLVFSKDGLCHIGDADIKGNDSIKRVYHPDGKGPTLSTCQGGHREPKIMIPLDNHKSNSGLVCVGGLEGNKKWLDDGKNLQRNFSQGERVYSTTGKCPTLSAQSGGTAGTGSALISGDTNSLKYRKLTPLECERLQNVDDNYTNHVSNTQRYKMLGNGWTVDVIAHIFKNIPEPVI